MAKTLEVARWARFFVVPRRPAVLREDILRKWKKKETNPTRKKGDAEKGNKFVGLIQGKKGITKKKSWEVEGNEPDEKKRNEQKKVRRVNSRNNKIKNNPKDKPHIEAELLL